MKTNNRRINIELLAGHGMTPAQIHYELGGSLNEISDIVEDYRSFIARLARESRDELYTCINEHIYAV